MPNFQAAVITPIAIKSLVAKMAVGGSGSVSSSCERIRRRCRRHICCFRDAVVVAIVASDKQTTTPIASLSIK